MFSETRASINAFNDILSIFERPVRGSEKREDDASPILTSFIYGYFVVARVFQQCKELMPTWNEHKNPEHIARTNFFAFLRHTMNRKLMKTFFAFFTDCNLLM